MASVYYLLKDAQDVKQHITQKYLEFTEVNRSLFFAALKIQRTWRGYVVRKMIKKWNQAATTIQRFVRGFLVRWHLPEFYREHYLRMSEKYYNDAATKIQAFWKGYATKKIFSLKEIFHERAQISKRNDGMITTLKDLFEKNRVEAERAMKQRDCLKQVLVAIFDRHHLLRTWKVEGILSIHGSHELSQLEKLLKNLDLRSYMKDVHKIMRSSEPKTKAALEEIAGYFNLNTKIDPKPYERMLMTQNSETLL